MFLQAWKRSYSARLPQFLNLTTSKTQQFCETSSIFEFDNFKNGIILRDFFNFGSWQHKKRSNSARLPSIMESWVQSWRPRTNAFCDFFHSICLKYCASKKRCPVLRSAAPVMQNHLGKPEDLMLQNATALRKSAPWPPDISDEHVSCTALATENASLQILFEMCFAPQRVQFFINHLARWLRNRRFSEPTFRPSGATDHWKKTQCFATFLPFRALGSSFFWDFLYFDLLSSSLLFSNSSHLCFSSVHIVGSLTSKLPSPTAKLQIPLHCTTLH